MNSMSTAQGDFLFEVFNRLKELEGQLAKEEVRGSERVRQRLRHAADL